LLLPVQRHGKLKQILLLVLIQTHILETALHLVDLRLIASACVAAFLFSKIKKIGVPRILLLNLTPLLLVEVVFINFRLRSYKAEALV
jgi:hypothetical protein